MSNCLQIICELLACVILLSFHVTENTNGSEPLCVATIKVPRNTQFRALVMKALQINCTVIINKCDGNPKISWCRIDGNDCKALNKSNYTKIMWKNKAQNYGIAFLTFLNISMDDAGLYRCKTQNSVSHAINVTVSDDETSHTQNNTRSEPLCVATIKVPRNTQFRALVMTELQINCTVIINKCDGNPKISWCRVYGNDCKALNKLNHRTMWRNTIQNYGIAFLTFLNISMDDAGLYRCKTQNSVSHAINVMVNNKDDGSANIQNNANYDMRQYVGVCRWIAGLTVILTGVSFIIIRSKSRNDKEENEAMITIYLDPSPLVPKTDDAHSISSSSIYANIEHL